MSPAPFYSQCVCDGWIGATASESQMKHLLVYGTCGGGGGGGGIGGHGSVDMGVFN